LIRLFEKHPPVFMRQKEVEGCNHYEKEGEVDGVEEHLVVKGSLGLVNSE